MPIHQLETFAFSNGIITREGVLTYKRQKSLTRNKKKSPSIDSAYQHNSRELMKYNRAERDTSRIFAIEALDTFLANNVCISSSLPSNRDVPCDPLGLPSTRPFARAAAGSKARRAEETSGRKKSELKNQRESVLDQLSEISRPEVIIPTFSIQAGESGRVLVSISDGCVGFDSPVLTFINVLIIDMIFGVNVGNFLYIFVLRHLKLQITNDIFLPDSEIELTAIRAQGSGGQHINKVSSAIHLRFNIEQSSLPDTYKTRLLHAHDYRYPNLNKIQTFFH